MEGVDHATVCIADDTLAVLAAENLARGSVQQHLCGRRSMVVGGGLMYADISGCVRSCGVPLALACLA